MATTLSHAKGFDSMICRPADVNAPNTEDSIFQVSPFVTKTLIPPCSWAFRQVQYVIRGLGHYFIVLVPQYGHVNRSRASECKCLLRKKGTRT